LKIFVVDLASADPALGLKSSLPVTGHVQKNNFTAFFLEVDRNGGDPETGDEHLDRVS